MRIGILETGKIMPEVADKHSSFPQMFARLLEGHGFEYRCYDVENMDFPDTVHAQDGWLITGSVCGTYEPHPFIPPLEDFIRRAYDAAVPMVGVCFGHQIIARALGGDVRKYSGGWVLGHSVYDYDGTQIRLNSWHQDQVLGLPDCATKSGGNKDCKYAIIEYGNRMLSFQPHPEFSDDVMLDYAKAKLNDDSYDRSQLQKLIDEPYVPNDSAKIGKKIAQFFLSNARGEA